MEWWPTFLCSLNPLKYAQELFTDQQNCFFLDEKALHWNTFGSFFGKYFNHKLRTLETNKCWNKTRPFGSTIRNGMTSLSGLSDHKTIHTECTSECLFLVTCCSHSLTRSFMTSETNTCARAQHIHIHTQRECICMQLTTLRGVGVNTHASACVEYVRNKRERVTTMGRAELIKLWINVCAQDEEYILLLGMYFHFVVFWLVGELGYDVRREWAAKLTLCPNYINCL